MRPAGQVHVPLGSICFSWPGLDVLNATQPQMANRRKGMIETRIVFVIDPSRLF